MKTTLPILLLGAGLSALAAGLTDAAGLALGGGTAQTFLAGSFVLCALGAGALGVPRRLQAAAARPKAGLAAALWAGAAGLLLPRLAPLLAPLTAGPPFSPATLWGWLVLSLLLGWPLFALGARTAAAMDAGEGGAWNGLIFGTGLGWCTVLALGLGPSGHLAAAALVALLHLGVPRAPERVGEEPGKLLDLLPAAFLGAATVFLLLFVLPHLGNFDGGAAPWDAARIATFFLFAWLGAVTFGSAVAESAFARAAGALLCGGMALGVSQAALRLRDFADPRVFGGYTAWDPFLKANRLLGGGTEAVRLSEGEPLYVPVLTLAVTVLAALFLGSALRVLARAGTRTPSALAGGRTLGAFLLCAGLAWLGPGLLAHPGFAPQRPTAAFAAALAAGAAAALTAPRPRSGLGRGVLALLAAGAPLLLAPVPHAPPTGIPFYDNFEWRVEEERPALASMVRVASRNANPTLGREFLTDGRNLIGGDQESAHARTQEALFAAGLTRAGGRALLVGAPDADSVRALQHAGFETHLACDPPELAAVALEALDANGVRVPAAWRGLKPARVTATAAEAAGLFELVLVRDEAVWDRRRNPLRPALFATCARRLAPGGVIAVVLDPERSLPGLAGAVARSLGAYLEQVEIWLLPRGWRTPRLVVTGRRGDGAGGPATRLQAELRELGLDIGSPEDLALLRLAGPAEWKGLGDFPLAPPLCRAVPRLAVVEYRREDALRPTRRAAAVLAELEDRLAGAKDTLLPFLRRHLEAQIYSVDDTLFVPDVQWIDVSPGALEVLLETTRAHPGSALLRTLWTQIGPLLIAKREVDLAERFVGTLVGELGLSAPEFDTVLGNAALELLEPERALRQAERALGQRERYLDALSLKARALVALERPEEAAAVFGRIFREFPVDDPALLRAYGEALLDADDVEGARDLGGQIRERFGDEALGHRLAALLGVELPGEVHR